MRIHRTGHDDFITPRNRSGLSREHVHGPLIGLDDDASLKRATEFLRLWSFRITTFAMGFAGAIGVYHAARYVGSLNLWFVL